MYLRWSNYAPSTCLLYISTLAISTTKIFSHGTSNRTTVVLVKTIYNAHGDHIDKMTCDFS